MENRGRWSCRLACLCSVWSFALPLCLFTPADYCPIRPKYRSKPCPIAHDPLQRSADSNRHGCGPPSAAGETIAAVLIEIVELGADRLGAGTCLKILRAPCGLQASG